MILYKKDSKGKLRVLEIFAEGDQVVQRSGLFDGKKSETRSSCIGKNIGRSNETSPKEQAIQEAEAKIKKKLEKEYFKTKEEAEGSAVLLPMLAKDYKKESHKIDWSKDVFIQPKLDGMRCLAVVKNGKVSLMSREGKDLSEQYGMAVQHILKDVQRFVKATDVVLDGEIYCHGKTFQENMKLIKKYRPSESEELCYHVYDIADPSLSFKARYSFLSGITPDLEVSCVKKVHTIWPIKDEMVKICHEKFLSEGYEGSIIRHGDDGYKVKGRSSSLLKYKDFIDEVFEIVDVLPFEKYPEQGKFKCKLKDGRTFETGMKMSHEEREEVLANKVNYIGKMAEVRFFEWTDGGLPRFPQAVGVRLDK